jgi:hypothetical protein
VEYRPLAASIHAVEHVHAGELLQNLDLLEVLEVDVQEDPVEPPAVAIVFSPLPPFHTGLSPTEMDTFP